MNFMITAKSTRKSISSFSKIRVSSDIDIYRHFGTIFQQTTSFVSIYIIPSNMKRCLMESTLVLLVWNLIIESQQVTESLGLSEICLLKMISAVWGYILYIHNRNKYRNILPPPLTKKGNFYLSHRSLFTFMFMQIHLLLCL